MKIKLVMRWDEVSIYRLFRLMGNNGVVGNGYSWKLGFALTTRPSFRFIQSPKFSWVIYFLIFRISYHRAYGGIFV